jgi:hypothetical protein
MGESGDGAITPAESQRADADKAHWDARKSQLDAEQTERQNAEWDSAAARRQRQAEHASATAKAEQEAAESRQKQITSLIPSLAGIDKGETKVAGEQPLYGQALARRALDLAAAQVLAAITPSLGQAPAILITSDSELATSDAAYLEVRAGIDQLTAAADRLLAPAAQEFAAAAALGAVAAAVPQVISLLSAHRSITTTSASVDDLSAAVSVAGALAKANVNAVIWHDGFRTLPADSSIYQALETLRDKRRMLAAGGQDEGETVAGSGEPAPDADPAGSLATAIDQFATAVTAVPAGATRSMLTNAALREGLHTGAIRHVLLVKGSGSSTSQLVEDRPLWWKDKFCVVAAASVTYLLILAGDGRVVAGGTGLGTAMLQGKIGDQITVEQAG